MSIRFGMSTIFLIRPNVRRSRRLFATCCAPCAPIRFTFQRAARSGSRHRVDVHASVGAAAVRRVRRALDAASPAALLSRAVPTALLDLDLAAGVLELLPHVLGILLGDAFLDALRCAVDEILGLLQAEAGELADDLDHLDLL